MPKVSDERTLSQAERLDRLRADGLGLLSFHEAAAYIGPGFTKRWVEDRVYDKVDPLPSFRLGGKRLIRVDDLIKWVEAQRVKAIVG